MKTRNITYTRLGKIGEDDDRLQDYEYWDSLGDEVRFEAAWDLVVQAWEIQGREAHELRFQRTVGNIYRRES